MIMAASLSHLTETPVELLEQILLYLPSQDIVKMETVNRQFLSFIRNSPALHHRCELFAIGLVDNPCCPCSAVERRKLREEYTHKWTNAGSMVESTRELPPLREVMGGIEYFGHGHAAYSNDDPYPGYDIVSFLHIPPLASRKAIEGWTLCSFPFQITDYAVYPPEGVIAIAELEDISTRIHLVNLRDGSPYRPPPSNVIPWEFPPGSRRSYYHGMAITNSRVALATSYDGGSLPDNVVGWKVVVWDWKTGDLLLELTSTFVPTDWPTVSDIHIDFLDEFRILVSPETSGTMGLSVFNTLLPQQHLTNLGRKLGLPHWFHNKDWTVSVHTDGGRPLGRADGDERFLPDPAQAVLIIQLANDWDQVFLIMRTQTLIDQTPSTCTSDSYRDYVPWDEWRGDTAVLEAQMRGYAPRVFIHGAQVELMGYPLPGSLREAQYVNIWTFDFSRRGRGSMGLVGGGKGGTLVSVPLDSGRHFKIEPGDIHGVMDVDVELRSLNDGSLFYVVSCHSQLSEEKSWADVTGAPGENRLDHTIHVWELV